MWKSGMDFSCEVERNKITCWLMSEIDGMSKVRDDYSEILLKRDDYILC